MQRGECDAGGIALFERGDAGGVISAEAVSHDGDALGIDIGPARDVVEGGATRNLIVVTRMDAAHA